MRSSTFRVICASKSVVVRNAREARCRSGLCCIIFYATCRIVVSLHAALKTRNAAVGFRRQWRCLLVHNVALNLLTQNGALNRHE